MTIPREAESTTRRLWPVSAVAAVTASATLIALVVAWKLGALPKPNPPSLVSLLIFTPLHALASVWMVRASRTPGIDTRTCAAWRWMAASEIGYVAMNITWFVAERYFGAVLGLTPLDILPLVWQPLALVGVLSIPTQKRGRDDALRRGIDLAMVLFASATLVWYFVLQPAARESAVSTFWTLVLATDPVLACATAFATLAQLVRRPSPAFHRALIPLAIGYGLAFAATVLSSPVAFSSPTQWYSGLRSSLWALENIFLLVAAISFVTAEQASHTRENTDPEELGQHSIVPYIGTAAISLILIAIAAPRWRDPLAGIAIGALGLTALTLARQFITFRENRLLQEARRAQDARFRSLVEHSSDLIVLLDAGGMIRWASPATERILSMTPTTLLGTPMHLLIHPDDRGTLTASLRQPGSRSFPMRLTGLLENWHDVEVQASDLRDDPAVGGIVLTLHDVTEQRALEAQLRQAQKMEAVGRLAGGIAHDFNNLLAVIRLSGQSVMRGPTSRAATEDLREIDRAVERGAALTRQLLAFSRKQVIVTEDVELGALLREAEPMLRRVLTASIRLDVAIDRPIVVRADRSQIDQILLNLVVNSRDAMPDGGVLRVELTESSYADDDPTRPVQLPPGRYAQLRVIDNGLGMDAATVQRAFEPFFTTKPMGQGSGLGLATVYTIAAQAGGTVGVMSRPRIGTTVTVSWPVATHVDTPMRSTHAPTARGDGELLMVVDDEPAIARVVSRQLEQIGYGVMVSNGGLDALARLEQSTRTPPVDLLLTDMVMPDCSGRELIDRVRDRWPEIRVVCMSGHTEDDVLRDRGASEGVGFVQKPFTTADLASAIGSALGQSVRAEK